MASADVKEAVEVQAAEDAAEGIAPADLKARTVHITACVPRYVMYKQLSIFFR